jgi:hypothetical protein
MFAVPAAGLYRLKVVERNWLVWEQDIRVGGALEPTPELSRLAETFAPILFFHEDEQYSPVALDDTYFLPTRIDIPFSEKSEAWLSGKNAMAFLATHGHRESIVYGSPEGAWWEDAKKPPATNDSTIYWTAHETPSHLYLSYWFFYPYATKAGIFSDLGVDRDWESITVFLKKTEAGPQPVALRTYQHAEPVPISMIRPIGPSWSSGYIDLAWVDVDLSRSCKRPMIYVALGSHTPYPRQGRYRAAIVEEFSEGSIRHCPTSTVSNSCQGRVDLRPLGVGTELSAYAPWGHLSFSGAWVSAPKVTRSLLPPFSPAFEEPTRWNGDTSAQANLFTPSTGAGCACAAEIGCGPPDGGASSTTDAGVEDGSVSCSGTCNDRSECGPDLVCSAGECCPPPESCSSSEDCPMARPECNGFTEKCFGGDECFGDSECDPATPSCIDGVCTTNDCLQIPGLCQGSEVCDPETGRCVPNPLVPCPNGDTDCQSGYYCDVTLDPDECRLGCRGDGDCLGGLCNASHQCEGGTPAGLCEPCNTDADCPAGTTCSEGLPGKLCYESCNAYLGELCVLDPSAQCVLIICSCSGT